MGKIEFIFPKNIKLKENGTEVTLILSKAATGFEKKGDKNVNMQDDEAAFEGWALLLKAQDNAFEKVCLDADIPPDALPNDETKLHYRRFLYRAMRFSENYGAWFSLSPRVSAAVEAFRAYYYSGKPLCNNTPGGEAGENSNAENMMEARFSRENILGSIIPGLPCVYRQLPVGLFVGDKRDDVINKNRVFTGGKSAIDLWGIDYEYNLHIFELKANANIKVGILTELFFYAAYMYDMYCTGSPEQIRPLEGSGRGYETLYNAYSTNKINAIVAHVLADKVHPALTKDVFELMATCNNKQLHFPSPLIYKYCFSVVQS